VKVALANVLSSMSHILGRDFTNTKILPLALSLLNEENHDIKLAAIKGLDDLATIVGVEILTPSLVEQLQNLAKEPPQWRLREMTILLTVKLAKVLGQEVFISKLEDIFFLFLSDSVASVRESGVRAVGDLCTIMTNDWV